MNRDDKSKFFLFIEPKKEDKSATPIEDEITRFISFAMRKAVTGTSNYSTVGEKEHFSPKSGYRGSHTTDCGEHSDNKDYELENGLITNSLCTFYFRWYRSSIHKNDWSKLIELGKFYGTDIPPYRG